MGPNHGKREEIITCPTKTEVRTRTTERVRKFIHPTEIINVHRTVIRNEHVYPVHEREVHETVEKGSPGCGESDMGKHRRGPSWI
ncbi:CotD family spore coat protein [Siminovitchia terrae]|uniref:CotD family spore coat protein n=1 Tax=Siminovitchia terrae TaxID=1914933 RepID=UPI0028A713B1|nr:CotD family spore coat protein [Siminovitchia terrae]